MSQLELALKKARAARDARDLSFDGTTAATPNPAFVSAWDFEEGHEAPVRLASVPVEHQPATPAIKPLRHVEPARPFRELREDVREKLVIGDHGRHDVREQFRKIAAGLYRLRETQGTRVVMIVSAVPGEGKTLTATNLALTLSESYLAKVLLIDADLRRPSVHEVFDISNNVGLKDKLYATDSDSVGPVRISPHLAVLPAGSASGDPMGLLVSDRMRAIVKGASADCDWVVLDTPPVALMPDARILASMADVALLVVHAGTTKCELARKAVETIGRERVVGVVLNQLADTGDAMSDQYYGYYGAPRS